MSNGRILIIEAGKELLMARTKTLSRDGYQVTGVTSIEEALKVISEQDYELLILRPQEPELLNLMLVRFPADLAVLVVAPEAEISRAAVSSGTGIRAFLAEPFSANKLRETVVRTINGRRLVAENFRNKALMTLGQASHLLTPGIDIDKFLNIAAEMSAAATSADYVSLITRNEKSPEYRVRARHGEPADVWDSLCSQLAGATEPILIDVGSESHLELVNRLKEAGAGALMMVPLVIKGEAAGNINLIRKQGKAPFAASDMSFSAVLGWWCNIALENYRLFDQMEQQREHVENLLQEVSHAQENERKRIAIEIHDGVAQWMVGAAYGIKACSALISQSRLAELEAELAKIGQTLQKSVRELRRTMANLRPLALEEGGLVSAIQRVTQPLLDEGIDCRLEVGNDLPTLAFAQETTTYWILQEAITNIRSHAAANRVAININVRDGQLHATVNDNGIGFDAEEIIKHAIPLEHMGLLGMQERARLLGGTITIDSHPGHGTTVSFAFPVSSYGLINATV